MNVIYAATDKLLQSKGGAYIDNCKIVPREYTRTCMHTCIHAYIDNCKIVPREYIHAYMHTCIHVNGMDFGMCICTYVRMDVYVAHK
jgi:hypothetical protein